MQQTPEHILKKYWGYDTFRSPQDRIIQSVLQGQDTLALLPTGGGKSICFQVPGMLFEGITIVVSPLISLMKDQVANLKARGIKATAIHTGMPFFIVDNELNNCITGHHKFLYISPERLKTPRFLETFKHMKVGLIAVDEAHCISQWGYDFRPVYLEIAEIRKYHPKTPVLALTATATPEVANDICTRLEFKKTNIISRSFSRDNLYYVVSPCERKEEKIMQWLKAIKGSSIVYTRNRKQTEQFAEFLNSSGFTADFYHAGLDPETRETKQKRWMDNQFRVMVATNAFGMGIDKPDVRLVLHTDVPENPEAYFQEAGRGGRDGKPAYAVLPVTPSDKPMLEKRFAEEFPERDDILRVYKALCNNLQIPVGAGENEEFKIDPDKLADTYNLKPGHLIRCIRLLEKEGYLYLNDSAFEVSTVHMKMGVRALYDFMVRQPKFESFVQTLIRSYGGVFEGYVRISEVKLAGRIQKSVSEVVEMLIKLEKLGVITYKRASNLPSVTFLAPRIPEADFTLHPKVYGQLKKNAKKRYEAMIGYISSADECRSRVLLRYFGEPAAADCGHCDVCNKNNKKETVSETELLKRLRSELIRLDQTQFSSASEILLLCKFPKNEVNLKLINRAVDEGFLSFNPAKGYTLHK